MIRLPTFRGARGLLGILLKALPLFLVLPVQAAENDSRPSSEQVKDREARVVVGYVDVRAGPAKAYISHGRIYRDERVSVRGKRGAPWVQVVTGKVRGWVPLKALVIRDPESVARRQGKLSPGRDRRLREYAYDAQGRRITRGEFTGSGEGTASRNTPLHGVAAERSFRIALGFGIGQIKRDFTSNADPASILNKVRLEPDGFATHLRVEWLPRDWLHVRLGGSDVRLASSRFLLDDGPGRDIPATAQEAELAVDGLYRLGHYSVGGSLGTSFQRNSFKATSPVVLALTTKSFGTHGGLVARGQWNAFEAGIRASVGWTLLTYQKPIDSGEAQGPYIRISSALNWWFSHAWGVEILGRYVHRMAEYSGVNSHGDILTNPDEPLVYDRAREKDTILVLALGIIFRTL